MHIIYKIIQYRQSWMNLDFFTLFLYEKNLSTLDLHFPMDVPFTRLT